MTDQAPLSVLVPVRNEAHNIDAALASVSWADEVYVVDSHSTDDTAARAEALGAKVVQFDYDGGWPKKKNWAIRSLPWRNPWILILDADERVTPQLAEAIRDAIKRTDVDGYYLRWKFIFLGRWMKHCWSHGWMLRLFRRDKGTYEDLGMRGQGGWDNEVHENLRVDGRVERLQPLLLHETNISIERWLDKQNQFSTWNAVRREQQLREPRPPLGHLFSRDPLLRRRCLKSIYIRLPFQPLLQFLYFYVVRKGFLDGREGFYFCCLRAAHELNTRVKMYESKINLNQASEEHST